MAHLRGKSSNTLLAALEELKGALAEDLQLFELMLEP
jgi:hypothetical protein